MSELSLWRKTTPTSVILTILLAGAISAKGANQQFVFQKASFPTGNRPSGIAVADVNGDGIQDLLVINQTDGTVSVLLGQPDGTFVKTDFPTGSNPTGIVAVDLNKDGKIDVAVTRLCGTSCGTVSLLLGNGDGSFKTAVDYPTAAQPLGVVAADFNVDGNLDLAVVAECGQSCGFVSILLGAGDGTFGQKQDYTVGPTPLTIVAQDLNRDGKTDLAVTTANGVSILLGNGDGTFQAHADYTSNLSPFALVAADFDGDHVPDLVITHNNAPWPLTIMKGKGDGSFEQEQEIPTGLPGGVATAEIGAADLNGDGKEDLVLTVVGQAGALVFLGNGNGTFQPPVNHAAGGYPFAFAIQDVNGDGSLDLEITDQQTNVVIVLLGSGDGRLSPKTTLPLDPPGINQPYGISGTAADFNGDGKPDLAIANSSGIVHVLLGNGKGGYELPVDTNALASGSLLAADFNGDGRQDLALTNGSGVVVLLGKGDGSFGGPSQAVSTSSTVQRQLLVGDFNNDGKPDLVTLANGFEQANPIYVSLGNGDGTFQAPKKMWNAATIPMGIAAGDFDGDGNLDLAVTVNPNGIAVMRGNGDGTFQSPVMYATDELPGTITVADLNGDGHPDIIAIGNKVDVFLGKGDGTFPARVDYETGFSPFEVLTGDFNADGKTDVIVSAAGGGALGSLEIFLGNGDGTLQPRVEITHAAGISNSNLVIGDLNQDGTSDVVAVGGSDAQFLSAPIATVSPASLLFGSVSLGQMSASKTVTLANSGNGPLDLVSATASSGYAVSNNCGVVAVRTSCELDVTFAPSTVGASSGLLTLSDNAPNPVQKVELSGTGESGFSFVVSTGSSPSATISAGSSANYALTIAPLGGFNQNVSFSCSGAPFEATCTVSPTSVKMDGQSSATLNVQVTTITRSAVPIAWAEPGTQQWPRILFPFAGLVLCWLAVSFRARIEEARQGLTYMSALTLFLVVLFGVAGCGGGSASTGGSSGTPAGNYTIMVTASSTGTATVQQSIKLTLIVN